MAMEKLIRRFNPTPSSKQSIDSTNCPFPVNGCFGISLEELYERDHQEVPIVVTQICTYLHNIGGLSTEGVFRISGNSRIIENLRIAANEQHSISLFEDGDDDRKSNLFMAELDRIGDVHSAACLLKTFLREIPLGVVPATITNELIEAYTRHPEDVLVQLETCLRQLPTLNWSLLHYVCSFLHKVVQNQNKTRMSYTAIGIIFGLSIFNFACESDSLVSHGSVNELMALLVEHVKTLFVSNSLVRKEATGRVGRINREQKTAPSKAMMAGSDEIRLQAPTEASTRFGQSKEQQHHSQSRFNFPEVTVEIKEQLPRVVGVEVGNSYIWNSPSTSGVIVTPTPPSLSESEPVSIRTVASSTTNSSRANEGKNLELSGSVQACLRECIIQHAFPGMRPPKSLPKQSNPYDTFNRNPHIEEQFLFTPVSNSLSKQSSGQNGVDANRFGRQQPGKPQPIADLGGRGQQYSNGTGVEESHGGYASNFSTKPISSLSGNASSNVNKLNLGGDPNSLGFTTVDKKPKRCNGDHIDGSIQAPLLSTQQPGNLSMGFSSSNRAVIDSSQNQSSAHPQQAQKFLSLEATFDILVHKLTQKRELARRPEMIGEMTLEQLDAEKLALQKSLLSFESLHGRPKERHERLVMHPLYDRYRRVKRLLTTISANKSLNAHPDTRIRELLRCPLGSDESDDPGEGGDGEIALLRAQPPTAESVRSSQVVKSSSSSTTVSMHSEMGSADSRQEGVQTRTHKTGDRWNFSSISSANLAPGAGSDDSVPFSSTKIASPNYQVATTASVSRNYSSSKSPNNEWFGSLGLSSTRVAPGQTSKPIASIYNTRADEGEDSDVAGDYEQEGRGVGASTPVPQDSDVDAVVVTRSRQSPDLFARPKPQKSLVVNPTVAPVSVGNQPPAVNVSGYTFFSTQTHSNERTNERTEEEYLVHYPTLSLVELQTELKAVRDSKRVLQKLLKDSEHDFERRQGRKMELADRVPMHMEYNRYKTLKSRLLCLEGLLDSKSTGV